jgi:hypothetical protein
MTKKEFKVSGNELLKKIREIINEGNVRKIIIKTDKGEKFVELPVTIGVIGALAAPIFVVVGAIAALASKFTVEVVKVDKKAAKKDPKKK